MLLLALDTAGTGCFACIFDSGAGKTLSVAGEDIGRGHAERLMAFVDEALEGAGKTLENMDRIAVTIGPGSFTGIRVGVAAARGLALALGRPAVGISTLEVLARQAQSLHAGEPVLILMDAKRGELYGQSFDAKGAPSSEPALIGVEEARARFSGFSGKIAGSGAWVFDDGRTEPGDTDRFDIEIVARLGFLADPAAGKPAPLYLRGADAKPQAGFALSRA